MRDYLLDAGRRYWPWGRDALAALPVPRSPAAFAGRAVAVELPEWAADLGVGTPPALLVDASTLLPGDGRDHRRCDWWSAAFHHLNGAAERKVEAKRGPIHSYSYRLRGVDRRLFERAWVNRIFLFLRRWAARRVGRAEEELFGRLPAARFRLTHDVDAVSKTPALRFKEASFHGFNASRLAVRGRIGAAAAKLREAARFVVGAADYWCFPSLRALEERSGVRSTFHLYAGPLGRWRGPRRSLLDPAYDPREPRLAGEIRSLIAGGWTIGLHLAFDSWRSADRMAVERAALEAVAGVPVVCCRQHWLRFSWRETWKAQADAGLTLDSSLGFNDRPGFRNGCALRFRPWDPERGGPLAIEALPLLFMDSHFYSYELHDDGSRAAAMARWLEEVRVVGGEVSLLWHQRVLHPDYGWGAGYEDLVARVAGTGL